MDELSIGHFHATHNKSRGFESFIRSVGDSKSKHEENKVIRQELVHLKEQSASANVTSKQTRELLIRLIYCEMLGHDASFGHIHAIKFAQQSSLLEKRTGYLAASIFFQKDNQLVVLLINTLQKDLKSTNLVAKSIALNVICKLVDADMIPALLPLIIRALKDKRVEIRKKTLMTLQCVHKIKATLVQDVGTHLINAMSDPDPSVVAASLHLFYDLIKVDPDSYRKYLKAFLQFLTQILEGKLSEFNYHGVQAPWIQIKLLKILAVLGKQHKSASENISPVLLQIINALPTDCNIGCAVVFECIQTITTIYALKPLLDIAFKKTGLFLTSSFSDLKGLGITAMTALVELDLSYAGDPKQQEIILNCLDDDDHTMRKKTLELLYKITNTENVVLVCAKLLEYLRATTEHYVKEDVVVKLTELAEKYAPDPIWYVQTINDVILATHGLVNAEIPHRLMKLIAAAENDENFKTSTVLRYIKLIGKKTLPDSLVQISCWVIGEYAYLIQDKYSLSDVLGKLAALLDRKFTDSTTSGWIVTAVAKLTARIGTYLPEARGIIDRYRTGGPAELRQRCHEINILAADVPSITCAFPVDSSQEDIKVCPSLSFLDEFVYQALSAGARPYQQRMKTCADEALDKKIDKPEIQIVPYEHPFKNLTENSTAQKGNLVPPETPSSTINSSANKDTTPTDDNVVPTVAKKRSSTTKTSQPTPPSVWGKTGYLGKQIKQESEQTKISRSSFAESSSKSSSSSTHEGPSKPADTESTLDNITQSPIEERCSDDPPATSAFFSGVTRRLPTPQLVTQDSSRVVPRDTIQPLISYPTVEETGTDNLEMVINDELEDIHKQDLEGIEFNIDEALTDEHFYADDQMETMLETDNNEDKSVTPANEGLLVELDFGDGTLISMPHFDSYQEENATALAPDILCEHNDNTLEMKSLMTTDDSFQLSQHISNDPNIEVCSDNNVRLVYSTVRNPTEMILSFKLTNHCQARVAVEQVAVTIEPPSNLVCEVSSKSMAVDSLAFLNNVTHNISLTCQYPAAHMSFKGTLNYVISRTPKVLHFCQEITLKDLLRPFHFTTEVFGEKWTTTLNDAKRTVTGASEKSCEELMDSIGKHMNFAVVDIIGCEGIAAATIVGKDICLLHCKFTEKNVIEIWVKTSSKLLSEITLRECVSFLQKSP